MLAASGKILFASASSAQSLENCELASEVLLNQNQTKEESRAKKMQKVGANDQWLDLKQVNAASS